MENKKFEQLKKIETELRKVNTALATISASSKMVIKVSDYGNVFIIYPKIDSVKPDEVFAEKIRTLIFKYYKLKQIELELEFKML